MEEYEDEEEEDDDESCDGRKTRAQKSKAKTNPKRKEKDEESSSSFVINSRNNRKTRRQTSSSNSKNNKTNQLAKGKSKPKEKDVSDYKPSEKRGQSRRTRQKSSMELREEENQLMKDTLELLREDKDPLVSKKRLIDIQHDNLEQVQKKQKPNNPVSTPVQVENVGNCSVPQNLNNESNKTVSSDFQFNGLAGLPGQQQLLQQQLIMQNIQLLKQQAALQQQFQLPSQLNLLLSQRQQLNACQGMLFGNQAQNNQVINTQAQNVQGQKGQGQNALTRQEQLKVKIENPNQEDDFDENEEIEEGNDGDDEDEYDEGKIKKNQKKNIKKPPSRQQGRNKNNRHRPNDKLYATKINKELLDDHSFQQYSDQKKKYNTRKQIKNYAESSYEELPEDILIQQEKDQFRDQKKKKKPNTAGKTSPKDGDNVTNENKQIEKQVEEVQQEQLRQKEQASHKAKLDQIMRKYTFPAHQLIENQLQALNQNSPQDNNNIAPILHGNDQGTESIHSIDEADTLYNPTINTVQNPIKPQIMNDILNLDDDIIFDQVHKSGHFKHGDIPKAVKSSRVMNSNIYIEIEWLKRKNGFLPLSTIMNSTEIRLYNKDLLLEYYESKILKTNQARAIQKPLSKSSEKPLKTTTQSQQLSNSKSPKEIIDQEVNIFKGKNTPNDNSGKQNQNNKFYIDFKDNSNNKMDENKNEVRCLRNNQISQKVIAIDCSTDESSDEFCIEDPYKKFMENENILNQIEMEPQIIECVTISSSSKKSVVNVLDFREDPNPQKKPSCLIQEQDMGIID